MSTAVYYNNHLQEDAHSKHSLPSLSQIMTSNSNNNQAMVAAASAAASNAANGNDLNATSDVFLQNGNSQPSTANTTPASSFSSGSGATNYMVADKCTCKSNINRIPRPRNAFILFRQKYHQAVLDEGNVIRTNPEVSRELGRRWRNLTNDEREHWNQLTEEEKTNHAKKYPGYRYTPRRNGKSKNCEYCKQKNLRQQQMQLHNQQLLQLQQDQYQQYLQYQQQQQQQQQMAANNYQTTMPSNNMQFYVPPNPFGQQNFQFQYSNDMVPTQEKLSPLSQVPYEQPTTTQPTASAAAAAAAPQPAGSHMPHFPAQFVGYEQPRFNSLPNPINANGNYGFDVYQAQN